MPYSRATIEPWLSGPPTSVTTAAARANKGVQAGVVKRGNQHFAGLQFGEIFRAVQGGRGQLHGPGWLRRRASGTTPSGASCLQLPQIHPEEFDLRQRHRRCDLPGHLPGSLALWDLRRQIVQCLALIDTGSRLFNFFLLQPEDIVNLGDRSSLYKPAANLTEHLTDGGEAKADIGQPIFAQWGITLGRPEEFTEESQAQSLQPVERRPYCRPPLRSSLLACGLRPVRP
jgi:hypothetical protein